MESVVGSVDEGEHHKVHEGDFHDGAEGRVASRAVGVVLNPVAHADHGGHAVDEQHSRANPVGFALKSHGVEQGIMDPDQHKAGRAD